NRARDVFTRRGVSPDRLTFVRRVPMAEYLRIYWQIDIALDPFPYGGGTTTCDALGVGVPVGRLGGRTAGGRRGLRILFNTGLPDLAANSLEHYIHKCVELSNDLPRLSELRVTLRDAMQKSPVMDATRFSRGVEAAYRTMWQRWCTRTVVV